MTQPTYDGRKPNRPQLLDEGVLIRFLTGIRAGNNREVSARLAGLNPDTMRDWLKRARGTRPDRPPGPEHVRFLRLVEEAEAAQEAQVTSNLFALTRKDWNAAKYFLEHRFPERWGPDVEPEREAMVSLTQNNVILIDRATLDGVIRERLASRQPLLLGDGAPPESGPDGSTRYPSLDSLRSED